MIRSLIGPRPTSPRAAPSVRGLVMAAAAIAMVAVTACGVNPQPTKYGDDYRDNFMLGCTGIDPDNESPKGYAPLASEKQCGCVYEGLVDKVPFDEAREFEEAQAEADSDADIEIPDNIARIFEDCESS